MIFASVDLNRAHFESFMESLPDIKRSKFDGIEICLWEDMNPFSREIKSSLEVLGLQTNIHNDIMRGERGLPDCQTRLLSSLKFRDNVYAKNFISHPIKPYLEYLARTRELFDSTGEEILLENVQGIKLDQIRLLGRPIVLDIGNLIKNGEYPKIGEYPNVEWIHIHDFKNGVDHLPLGSGSVDLDFLIRKFPKRGYTIELGSAFREWSSLAQDYRNSIDFMTNAQISHSSYGKNVRLAHLLRNIGKAEFNLAVDFGCGEGYLLHNILAKAKRGFDLSPRQVFNDIGYSVQDVGSAPIAGADLAICSEVIEHLEQDGPAINKLHDSLIRGGKIFLTTLNRNTSRDKSEIDKERGHFRRYGKELRESMEVRGFKTSAFYPIRSNHYYAHDGSFENYNPEQDIAQGEKDASGWVYFGEKK